MKIVIIVAAILISTTAFSQVSHADSVKNNLKEKENGLAAMKAYKHQPLQIDSNAIRAKHAKDSTYIKLKKYQSVNHPRVEIDSVTIRARRKNK